MNAIVRADEAASLREVPTSGAALYRMSSDAAALCRDIVVATAQNIGGRNHVRVEGWQAIALAHGCVASSGDVVRTESGISAIGRVVNMATGVQVASAEGFVGDDERMWAQRPEYARRAMAQTRAISRACRSAFAHVVVMMNAGLSTTPAEEMDEPEPPRAPPLQQAKATHEATRAAAQAAAVTPPPKRMTATEFLDGLDAELKRAPEAAAVEALMKSARVNDARAFLKGGAAERLADWTQRAEAKRQALADDEAEAAIAPEQSEQSAAPETMPADPLNATMPDDIDEWPLAGEGMAAG